MTKWIAWTLLASGMSCLAGCATTGSAGCDGWKAIRPAAADVATMSDSTVQQVLQHNRHGAAVCGWKA